MRCGAFGRYNIGRFTVLCQTFHIEIGRKSDHGGAELAVNGGHFLFKFISQFLTFDIHGVLTCQIQDAVGN